MIDDNWKARGFAVSLIILLTLAGCCVWDDGDSGSGGGSSPRPAVWGAPLDIEGNTSYRQKVPAQDSDPEVFPGYANVWDIDFPELTLSDGGNDQFDTALELCVRVGEGLSCFDAAAYESLTFYTPVFTGADGAIGAAVSGDYWAPIEGSYTAYLNAMVDARLWQIIDLTGAQSPVTLSWQDMVDTDQDGIPPELDFYQVVLRDPEDNSILETLFYHQSDDELPLTSREADLSSYAGEVILLSFERRTNSRDHIVGEEEDDGDRVDIDSVSITDDDSSEFVTNGDFEMGNMTGWSQDVFDQVQNYTTDSQGLLDLDVARSFFTHPTSLWARWTDTFTNNTDEPVTATAEYWTELGSDYCGIIYMIDGTEEMALATWDGSAYDRDIGMVFGMADVVEFTSDDGLCKNDAGYNGSDEIMHGYNIVVQPGEMVTIINFVIMSGADTGEGASSISARATAVDNEARRIIDRLNTYGEYRDGMTLAQMETITNFTGADEADNCAYVNGDWILYVSDVTSSCGGEGPWQSSIEVTQDGCSFTVNGIKGEDMDVSGMIVGDMVTIDQADYPDEGGTTTTEFVMTFDPEAMSLSGSEYWTWSGGGETCVDGTANVLVEMDE